MAVFQHSK